MNNIKVKRLVGVASAAVLILCSAGLIVAAGKINEGGRAEWPTKVPYDAAIEAFDAALTKSVRDSDFRSRLIKSTDSAREAVAEVGNINVPPDRVILFYEAQPAPGGSPSPAMGVAKPSAMDWASRSNENIHVFVLPPKTADASKQYLYEDHFMCCYQGWRRTKPPRP